MSYDPPGSSSDAVVEAMLVDSPLLLMPMPLHRGSIWPSTDGPGTSRLAQSFADNFWYQIINNASLSVQSLTVEFWFRRAATASQVPLVARDGGARAWYTGLAANGSVLGYSNNSTGPVKQTVATGLDDGAWHHFAWAYEAAGGTGLFVVDGAQDSTYTGGGTLPASSDHIEVGFHGNAGTFFGGDMCLFGFFGSKLSLAQIQEHYAALV